jgi:hypothetical protein
MTTLTDRQQYREAVAVVADKARAILPASVNGRIESAVKLVLMGDVFPQPDGTVLVGSSSDAMRSYTLQGQTCECRDYVYGKEIEGWCAHRIAAGIAKRVGELLPVVPEVVEPWPDNDPETEPQSPPVETEPVVGMPTTAPAPLPEARSSMNATVLISGHRVQITLRGHDELEVLARLETLLARYPVEQAPAAPQADITPQCPQHGAMRQGKYGWFCPTKLSDDTWCPHKAK